jgi:TonB family protein
MDTTRPRLMATVGLNLTLICMLALGDCAVSAQDATSRAPAKESPTYAESDAGFETQFRAIFHARCSGDPASEQSLLEQLKIPGSARWFAQNFDPGEAANLTERYERLFSDYRDSIEKTIESTCEAPDAEIAVNHANAPGEHLRIARGFQLSTTRPLTELALSRFTFAVRLRGQNTGSWAETFVYRQGAFRFVGLGTLPFWSWVEGAGPSAFKNGHFVVPMEPIYQVPLDYPPAARANHIEGVVVLRALIDKEGKVKTLELIQGDPRLVDAAMAAVKQWRFKPATIGGSPAEADTNVSVVFQLRKN